MANGILIIGGKRYVKMVDKLVEVDRLDADGKPVLKCWSEEIPNATGGMDCTVHVECLQIVTTSNKPS